MFEYLKKNKKYIYIFIISILIVLNFIYYFSDENTQIKQNSEIKYIQKDVKEQKTNDFFEEKSENHKLEIKEKKDEIIPQKEEIKNPIVLFSTLSEKGTYSLKLISNKEIDSQKSTVSYIVVTGNILDTDSNIDIFSLSLNENYIYNLNNITLEITNKETKKINSCDGNFLNTILPEFSYHVQIDIKEDSAHCYIKSQSEGENGAKFDNRLINDLDFDKKVINQEKTLIDVKELGNLKSVEGK